MYTFKYIPNVKRDTDNYNLSSLLKVKTAPTIPLPEEIVDEITLGDGTTSYRHTGVYKDRKIEIECSFVKKSKQAWLDNFSAIKRYFKNQQGTLFLESEDLHHYFKVKKIDIDINSRIHGVASEFTIAFTCAPYRYLIQYSKPYSLVTDKTVKLNNPYELSCPVYRIYNTSTNAQRISILCGNNALFIDDPFEQYIDYHEERYKVTYIDIDTESECMITHYKHISSEETISRYTTIKTSGAFDGITLKEGINEIYCAVDIGALSIDILRNYREL